MSVYNVYLTAAAIAQGRMSGVQPDVRSNSEKYLSHNKRKTSEHSAELGVRCPIMQNAASIAWSWTSGVRPDVRSTTTQFHSDQLGIPNDQWHTKP